MHNKTSILLNEDGSIIIVVVIILALLSIIGLAASNTSTTEMQISTNEQLHKIVFYAADAGIEVGRQVLHDLKSADPGLWDNILSGTSFVWQNTDGDDVNISTLDEVIDATWNRNVGLAAFTLQVSDNDDLDRNPLLDMDNIIVLISTATYRNARAQVQATVHYRGPADAYAQEHYDTDNTGTALNESAQITSDQRW